jgi:hypothetical protein
MKNESLKNTINHASQYAVRAKLSRTLHNRERGASQRQVFGHKQYNTHMHETHFRKLNMHTTKIQKWRDSHFNLRGSHLDFARQDVHLHDTRARSVHKVLERISGCFVAEPALTRQINL